MKNNTLKITLNDDGTVSVDATGMAGSEKEILAQLNSLASSIGGDLKVEKHVHGAHTHTHEKGGHHAHNH
jgi:hypothetical protein